MKKYLKSFDDILEKFSRWGLIFSLYSILCFSLTSILVRWLGFSILWIEPLVRHLVFLSAFLGGSLATKKGVHIKVDLFTHLIERKDFYLLQWLHRNLVGLFCFITCFFLTLASWDFFKVEREFGSIAFLDIHSSFLILIIPVGTGLISFRFFNLLLIGKDQG
jgi:TRAP-type C4-dicarboxylate transport system permease small subunit